jgi:hypothetical protein
MDPDAILVSALETLFEILPKIVRFDALEVCSKILHGIVQNL